MNLHRNRQTALVAVLDRWSLGPSPKAVGDASQNNLNAPADPDPFMEDLRPVLDTHVLDNLERLGKEAGVDLVSQLADQFLVDADAQVSAMRQALVADDQLGVARPARALRGASTNLGATNLARLCEMLELNGTADGSGGAGGLGVSIRAVEVELELVRNAFVTRSVSV
jgi:HPt (histidine-containing phosphotransfer) domain-containing protein